MTYLGTPRIDSRVPYAIGRKILATFGPGPQDWASAVAGCLFRRSTPKRASGVPGGASGYAVLAYGACRF